VPVLGIHAKHKGGSPFAALAVIPALFLTGAAVFEVVKWRRHKQQPVVVREDSP
jgi:hypothetical protein